MRYKAAGKDIHGWNLVEVDIDNSDQERALKLGEYQCKFYIRHHRDSATMKQHECRYWPELRSCEDGYIGRYHPVAPAKAAAYIRKKGVLWREDTVCLAEDRMAGPFNFISVQVEGKQASHRVPEEEWSELENNAVNRGMDVQSIRRIAPLIR